MRLSHWEALRPVCPRCSQASRQPATLLLAETLRWANDEILLEGVIHCPESICRQEYPIIDGIPILMPNVREYVAAYAPMILQRQDLSTHLESLVGDCLGPDDQFNMSRYYLSSYAHDGYVRDMEEDSTLGLLNQCVTLADLKSLPTLPVIELGSGVGRCTFALAEMSERMSLGVDINFSMIRLAQQALLGESISFARRQLGLVYAEVTQGTHYAGKPNVDFWVADAQALPFQEQQFGLAVGLNILDSVYSPVSLLEEIERIICPGSQAIVSTPFDWSAQVTPVENWIGGHSQRSTTKGSPIEMLAQWVTEHSQSLSIAATADQLKWSNVRSDRSKTVYEVFAAALLKG